MDSLPRNELLEIALRYFGMGYAVMPLNGKRARLLDWTKLAHPDHVGGAASGLSALDEAKVRTHFSAPWADGVGILTGSNSGNIIVLDLESAEILAALKEHSFYSSTSVGAKLSRCPRSRTPSGGAHIFLRLAFPAPGKSTPAAKLGAHGRPEALIEILAQGQCAAEPVSLETGSGERHWEQPLVPFAELEQFSQEEFQIIEAVLGEFNEMPLDEPKRRESAALPDGSPARSRPITEFNRDPANHHRIIAGLQARGWQISNVKPTKGGYYLSAPGKTRDEVSASFGTYRNGDVWYFTNYNTNVAEFPRRAISPFDVVAVLEHGGDESLLLAELSKGAGLRPKAMRKAQKGELVTVPLSNFKPKPVNWLVTCPAGRGMFAAGLSIIAGDPGSGKSTILRALVARFTRAHAGCIKQPGMVLYLAWEDDRESVVIPGIIAESGDISRVEMIEGMAGEDDKIIRWSAKCIDKACDWLRTNRAVKLVVVDTLEQLMSSAGGDSNKAGDVRKILEPLHQVGLELGVAVVVLHHTNKKSEGSAQSRISGSVQVCATARQVYFVGKDPNDENIRHIALAKSNLSNSSPGFSFKIALTDPAQALKTATASGTGIEDLEGVRDALVRVHVLDGQPPRADQLVRREPRKGDHNVAQRCAQFLAQQLSERGPIDSAVLISEAQERGWEGSTFNRAKDIAKEQFGVISKKLGSHWKMVISGTSAPNDNGATTAI